MIILEYKSLKEFNKDKNLTLKNNKYYKYPIKKEKIKNNKNKSMK